MGREPVGHREGVRDLFLLWDRNCLELVAAMKMSNCVGRARGAKVYNRVEVGVEVLLEDWHILSDA